MTRCVARLAIASVCGLSASVVLASPGLQHPHASMRPSDPAGHQTARPEPHTMPTPAMPGPTSAQVLSGPLPWAPPPPTSPFSVAPSVYAPRYMPSPFNRLRGYPGLGAFVLGGYGPFESTPPTAVSPEAPATGPRAIGMLLLDVEPDTARVYVDGVDSGVVSDFRQTGLTLLTGRHRIELRAAGYESLTIDVTIVAGLPTRYRGNLPAARAPAAEHAPRHGPDTFYVIPGCYAGNRPPIEQMLPAGCDVAKLRSEPIR